MIGALVSIAISGERGEPRRSDKAQSRNWVARRRSCAIGQIEAAQRNGSGLGVIELDEIALGGELRVCKPFVDDERTIIAEVHRNIRASEGRLAQSPGAICLPANRIIVQLDTKRNRVNERTAIGHTGEKRKIIAALLEREASVNARRGERAVRIKHQIC